MKGMLILFIFTFFATRHDMSDRLSNGNRGECNHRLQSSETAVFGAGCFWCVEAVFSELKGVLSVQPGYAGGQVPHPTYEQVCSGNTGHVEVCRIEFNPNIISYGSLLEVFWQIHDPTTIGRQGNDIGSQYASVIFYTNPAQKELAQLMKDRLNASGAWSFPVVTEIRPLSHYFPAEAYHRNYYRNNASKPYCTRIIRPKLEKFRKAFEELR